MAESGKTYDFKKIESEYLVGLEDDDLMFEIKSRFFSLTEAERRIFLVYLEEGSYAGVAQFFGVSSPTSKKYIKRIIEKLK